LEVWQHTCRVKRLLVNTQLCSYRFRDLSVLGEKYFEETSFQNRWRLLILTFEALSDLSSETIDI
jgi:hypothetical protein